MKESRNFAHHFGIGNIPLGIASSEAHPAPQCVTRFENDVIFLAELDHPDLPAAMLVSQTLNDVAAQGQAFCKRLRNAVQSIIRDGLLPQKSREDIGRVTMQLPVSVGDYTDFSCSPSHNRNASRGLMGFAGDLPPAYHHHPIGYAGRCSSISVSGTPLRRPRGEFFRNGREGFKARESQIVYGPSKDMDYELEMAVIVGKPVPAGEYTAAKDAHHNIFGYVLLNDWSARDIQRLEMIPVGPLNSKHVATTISPWVIMPDALSSYVAPAREKSSPLAPHLSLPGAKQLSVQVQVDVDGVVQGKSNVSEMDWTFEQLLAHQSSTGCGLRSGDILAIGTISGAGPDEQGCLMEQWATDASPRRGYLRDGEEVRITGYCDEGVGFGECIAKLLPPLDASEWFNI